jgi:hypothetical protein
MITALTTLHAQRQRNAFLDGWVVVIIPFAERALSMIRFVALFALLLAWSASGFAQDAKKTEEETGFESLFDGESLKGWKVNENPDSFKLVDGNIVSNGERSHLFYVGDDKPFKNFHFKGEVKTEPNSNAGIYFHTQYQDSGWPKHGFECQVNLSYKADPRKTSSLYAVKDVLEPAAKDNEWYTQEIIVVGKKITLKVNGKTLVEYTEPDDLKAGSDFTRKIDEGTFALQAHDPGSKVYFRNLRVKRLPD